MSIQIFNRTALILLLTAFIGACTSLPVDQAAMAQVKKITVTRLQLPEYSYVGLDSEAAAKSAGVIAGYYAFGVFGLAVGDAMRAKSEQPYREAIHAALRPHKPSFEDVLNSTLASELTKRGVETLSISAPPRLPDNTGYDFGESGADTDLVLEIFPLVVGFSYQAGNSAPAVDIRWRLLVKYPNGKLIEKHRGSIVHRNTKEVFGALGDPIPANANYLFKGHVAELAAHGEKPALAMQELASKVGTMIVNRVFPVQATNAKQ